jgi:glycosyltransferase involved in cell wall biosynthesis
VPRVTVLCIPASNNENDVERVVREATEFVDRVIVCDDGSADLTSARARSAGADVLRHTTPLGRRATMSDLLNEARASDSRIAVVMNMDSHNDPAFIPTLIAPLMKEESDIAVGVYEKGGLPAFGANLFALNSKALGTKAGADFFESMAGGNDRDLVASGLRLTAVFFEGSGAPRERKEGPKRSSEAEGGLWSTLDLLRSGGANALEMVVGLLMVVIGFALMCWAIWGFLNHRYANTMLMVFSSTVMVVGAVLAVSASMHYRLKLLSSQLAGS